jgi:hypothetical protein
MSASLFGSTALATTPSFDLRLPHAFEHDYISESIPPTVDTKQRNMPRLKIRSMIVTLNHFPLSIVYRIEDRVIIASFG